MADHPQTTPSNNVAQPREHNFDGIVEYDNDIPRWFTVLFLSCVLWAPGYIFWYHVWSPGDLGAEKLQKEDLVIAEERAKRGSLSEDDLRKLSANADRIAKGKILYTAAGCATCHGPDATGTVGPNLRDKYWVYGSDMSNILDVISKGRAEKGMPKSMIHDDDALNLTVFIVDLNRQGDKTGKAIDATREKETPITY